MSLLRRLVTWAGWSSRSTRVLGRKGSPEAQLGEIVRHRLSQIESAMEWPGKDVILSIGAHERELRTAAGTLRALESAPPAIARRAEELRRDVQALVAPDGRLAELIGVWPARWRDLRHRFVSLEEELRERRKTVAEVLETAGKAQRCSDRIEELRSRYVTTQPDMWRQLLEGLDLEHAVAGVETEGGARSALSRVEMAEQVLKESESLAVHGLLRLREVMGEHAGADAKGPTDESLEGELARRREELPVLCKAAVKDAGLRISNASIDHLQRLTNARESTVRTRVRSLFGEEPVGPLLYWAKLHYAKAKAPKPARRRR